MGAAEKRVSDEELAKVCRVAEKLEGLIASSDGVLGNNLALDLRDARVTLATTQAALKDALAEIAAAERAGRDKFFTGFVCGRDAAANLARQYVTSHLGRSYSAESIAEAARAAFPKEIKK